MSAWELAEAAFLLALLSLWLGFAICMVSLLVQTGARRAFSKLTAAQRYEAMNNDLSNTGSFLRSSLVGKIANALLVFGTIAGVAAGGFGIYARAMQPPTL